VPDQKACGGFGILYVQIHEERVFRIIQDAAEILKSRMGPLLQFRGKQGTLIPQKGNFEFRPREGLVLDFFDKRKGGPETEGRFLISGRASRAGKGNGQDKGTGGILKKIRFRPGGGSLNPAGGKGDQQGRTETPVFGKEGSFFKGDLPFPKYGLKSFPVLFFRARRERYG
jgi:hypothetical protein